MKIRSVRELPDKSRTWIAEELRRTARSKEMGRNIAEESFTSLLKPLSMATSLH